MLEMPLAFKATNLGEHSAANPQYMQILVSCKMVKKTGNSATNKHFPNIQVLPEDMELSVQA
jgi:hypothetical protein